MWRAEKQNQSAEIEYQKKKGEQRQKTHIPKMKYINNNIAIKYTQTEQFT